MTTITWPSELPSTTADMYEINPINPLIRTDMDSGPAKQRRLFTKTGSTFSIKWDMSRSQFGIFTNWYENTLNFGANYFKIDLLSAEGTINSEARFMQPFQAKYKRDDDLWRISAKLEVK